MQQFGKKIWNILEVILKFVFIKMFRIKALENNWEGFMQFVKFGLVGVSNTLINYVVYLIFLKLGCHYLVASVIGFIISVTNSYYWNNKYVFKEEGGEKRSWWKTYVKTFTAYASTGLLLANVLLILWIQFLHMPEEIAPLVNLLVTIPLNYIINKFWAYKSNVSKS